VHKLENSLGVIQFLHSLSLHIVPTSVGEVRDCIVSRREGLSNPVHVAGRTADTSRATSTLHRCRGGEYGSSFLLEPLLSHVLYSGWFLESSHRYDCVVFCSLFFCLPQIEEIVSAVNLKFGFVCQDVSRFLPTLTKTKKFHEFI